MRQATERGIILFIKTFCTNVSLSRRWPPWCSSLCSSAPRKSSWWLEGELYSKFNLKRRIGVAKEFRETNVYLESAACRAISRPLRHFSTQIFRRKERFAGNKFYISVNFTHFNSLWWKNAICQTTAVMNYNEIEIAERLTWLIWPFVNARS